MIVCFLLLIYSFALTSGGGPPRPFIYWSTDPSVQPQPSSPGRNNTHTATNDLHRGTTNFHRPSNSRDGNFTADDTQPNDFSLFAHQPPMSTNISPGGASQPSLFQADSFAPSQHAVPYYPHSYAYSATDYDPFRYGTNSAATSGVNFYDPGKFQAPLHYAQGSTRMFSTHPTLDLVTPNVHMNPVNYVWPHGTNIPHGASTSGATERAESSTRNATSSYNQERNEYRTKENFKKGALVQIENTKRENNKVIREEDKVWFEAEVLDVFEKGYLVKFIQNGKEQKRVKYPGYIFNVDGSNYDVFKKGDTVNIVEYEGNDKNWFEAKVFQIQYKKAYRVKLIEYGALHDKIFVRTHDRVRKIENKNTIYTFNQYEKVEMLKNRNIDGKEIWIEAKVLRKDGGQYQVETTSPLNDQIIFLVYPFGLRKMKKKMHGLEHEPSEFWNR
ncbi:hypothetical protein ACQ4LE_008252 [Meloidogyne hapla]|uniref:Tudor domain-containing protein n=1 Tax=Meloidogyne hapla TaxID=6305 RepID=A0A1I8B2J6_MELHA